MSALRTSRKPVDPLSRKVPQNPKYQDVQAVVDTGASMSKYLKKIEDIRTNYRYKPNELFKRMKITTFVQLVIQVSSLEDVFFPDDEASTIRPGSEESELRRLDDIPDTARSDMSRNQLDSGLGNMEVENQADVGRDSVRDSARSTLQSLISGVGEYDAHTQNKRHDGHAGGDQVISGKEDDAPYLILDVRTQDEFNECHMVSAKNFPVSFLARSCNYESKEMLIYKNKPGKIILMYDEDERLAPKAAATLVERGYDNLFLLSGGLKVAVKHYPEGLVTGTPPPAIASKKYKEKVRPSITKFYPENIAQLVDMTETAIQDKSTGSRLSRASTRTSSQASKAPPSSARSSVLSSASTITNRPAFR